MNLAMHGVLRCWLLSCGLFLLGEAVLGQTPFAQIGTSPAAQGGVVEVCAGSTIQFQSLSTGVGLLTTYTWNFGAGAVPATASGAGPHNVLYPSAVGTVNVNLAVDNQNGQPTDATSLTVVVFEQPQSNLLLGNSNPSFSTTVQDGLTVFKRCQSTSEATFELTSTLPSSWSQTFNWGDGTSVQTEADLVSQTIAHTYPIGQFYLTHTVSTPDNCSDTRTYIVFNGSAPLVNIEGQGATTCLPFPYEIDILSNDVPIDYVVSFSDNSPNDVFSTSSDTTLAHVFDSNSCGVDYVYAPGLPPIENAFSATIVAQNLCSVGGFPTVFTVGPITISSSANASFTQDSPNPMCENETVVLTDTSSDGANISSTGCDSTYSRVWVLPPGATVQSGELGTFNGLVGADYDHTGWTQGDPEVTIAFDGPGAYSISLFVGNSCGADSVVQVVEVIPTAEVDFSFYDQTLCSGDSTEIFEITATEDYTIVWSVGDFDGVNPVLPAGGAGLGPFDSPSWNPVNTGNQNGSFTLTATVACTDQDPIQHVVTVGPEGLVLPDPSTSVICSGASADVTIESNVDDASFSWTFNSPAELSGASNGTGSDLNDVLVNSGSSIQTVAYTISISGVACPGPDSLVYVDVQPQMTFPLFPDLAACPGGFIEVEDVEPVDGATWSWENDDAAVGLGNSGTGNVPDFIAGANSGADPLVSTVTLTGSVADCPEITTSFEVTVYDLPTAEFSVSPNGGLDCVTGEATINSSADPSGSTFAWSGPGIVSGIGSATPVVDAVGTYTAEVTANTTGCSAQLSVEVLPPTPLEIIDAQVMDVSCFAGDDGFIVVETDLPGSELVFDWTPAVGTNEEAGGLVAGSYNVFVVNASGCSDEVDLVVSQPPPIAINLVDSIASECGEENGLLQVEAVGGDGGFTYNWSGAPNGAVIDNIDAGDYTVEVVDAAGCEAVSTFALGCVELIPVEPFTFMSPNGDQKNDVWVIEHIDLYPGNEVWIYNRWGTLVHHASPYLNDWDGRFKGEEFLPSATYYFLIDTQKKSQDPIQGFLEIQTAAQ